MLDQCMHYARLEFTDERRELLERVFASVEGTIPKSASLHFLQSGFGGHLSRGCGGRRHVWIVLT